MQKMKAALYIRVSTTHQVDKDSLPFQRSELINYAKYALNIDEYEIFEDAGYSGKNTDRPKYQEMMNRVKKGEFTHLLVWKIDRISRNLLDFCAMYDEIKGYGVTFVSKNEQFDTSSAMGEAMLKIILVFAELERKLTAERVYGIMLSRAEKGLWNGANVPLGYKYDKIKKFPVPDAEESKTITLIFNKYLDEKSAIHVMKYLNDENIPTKRGGRWTSKTVTDIIRNPFYKGTYRYNYRESARGSKKDEKEWIVIDDNHEAIISKDTWERANKIMDTNAQKNTAFNRKNVQTHVFASMLKCSECGRGFSAHKDVARKDGYRPSGYRCQGKLNHFDCDAKMITDITLGPFIFNYISNFIRVLNENLDLESTILNGLNFEGVKVNLEDLNKTKEKINHGEFDSVILQNSGKTKPKKVNKNDTEVIKYKRALDRLEDLYLFDDTAMSEKDYLIKKKKIEDKIKGLKNKNTVETTDQIIDLSFLNKIDNNILKLELLSTESIDFKKLTMSVDSKLLKEFVNAIIKSIEIRNGKVSAINFKNGLKHRFIQKD